MVGLGPCRTLHKGFIYLAILVVSIASMTKEKIVCFCCYSTLIAGLTGLFCPCVLFGRNVESLNEETPWTGPCICHAIFIEGGIALATGTAILNGLIDPGTSFLIFESLFFTWWMCGIYTGQVRQSLQNKYHLKVRVEFFSLTWTIFQLKKRNDVYKIFSYRKNIVDL